MAKKAQRQQPGRVRTRHSRPRTREVGSLRQREAIERKLRKSEAFGPVLDATKTALLITVSYQPERGLPWHATLRGERTRDGSQFEGWGGTAQAAVAAMFEHVARDTFARRS